MAAGRPSQLNEQVQETICKYIREGNYRGVAAEAAGISKRTFGNWMREGKKATKGAFRQFFLAVLEAEKKAEIHCVKLVLEAAASDPKHAEWWLERKCSERWGSNAWKIRLLEKELAEIKAMLDERKNQLPQQENKAPESTGN